jgi:hypothetical protein
MNMSSIFLSYAGLDRAVATHVAVGLKETGVNVWWDREGIGWGDNWIHKLEDKLTQCGGYVILVGSSGVRRWVKFELSLAIKRHIEEDLPIFPLLLPGVTPDALPPFLATLQAEPLPEPLADIDYKKLAQRLARGQVAHPAGTKAGVPLDRCPFPGLEAFGENDTPFFFGRQKETLDAVSCLGLGLDGVYRRWLQVEGTSGVGKSSLIRAGLIPTIKKGWAGSTEAGTWRRWRVVEPMRPGADPILNLSEALSTCLSTESKPLSVTECHRILQSGDKALQVGLRDWVPSGEALVLVIDQLEEVFTLTQDRNVRERFDALLAQALADQDGPLHLITTIRSDFMMQFASLPCLQAHLKDKACRYLLNPINAKGLRAIVRVPAELAGLRWSDEELPDDVVQEARDEPGALPLVENLLRLLWLESRKTESKALSRQAYNDLGGVGGALAKSADALLASLGAGKQHALNLLTALVNLGGHSEDMHDTRRTISKSVALQAAGGGAQAENILNRLSGLRGDDTSRGAPARPRLVVLSAAARDGRTTDLVDLAHETLLRYNRDKQPYWPTLREEIRRRREHMEHRQLAEALAKQWRERGRSWWRNLATRSQLKAFRTLTDLEDDAAAYVAASRRFANGLNSVLALAAIVLIPYVAIAGWAQVQFHGLETRLAAKVIVTQLGFDLLSPDMVLIKAERFRMGDPQEQDDRGLPVPEVTLQKDFKLGKYEVTFDDYEPFVKVAGKGVIEDSGWGRGQRPAINVSWDDAKHYVDWLSKLTGKRYRLPTEAEWEYAARSGGKDQIWAGTSNREQLKDHAVYDARRTEPVGSKTPNDLGLHDMSGNVWEWVQDCEDKWEEGKCGRRVLRGGSWNDLPEYLRASHRGWNSTDGRGGNVGFRLVQDLEL